MTKKRFNLFILLLMAVTIIASYSMVASAAVDVMHYTAIYTDSEAGDGGGEVSPSDSFMLFEKLVDNQLTFTITPHSGFILSELKYNNEVIIPSGNNPYTFTLDAVSMNVTTFSKLEVYFQTEIILPPTVSTYQYGYNSVLKDTVTYEGDSSTIHNRITLFGILNPNGYTSFNYGILFTRADSSYESLAPKDMIVGAPNVSKFPAQSPYILPYYLYGVSLYGSNLNEGMFYIRPYVEYTVGSETVYSYGKVVNTILENPQPVVDSSSLSTFGTPLTNTENIETETVESTETVENTESAEITETIDTQNTETETIVENIEETIVPSTDQGGAE